jgi:hypothetical protein
VALSLLDYRVLAFLDTYSQLVPVCSVGFPYLAAAPILPLQRCLSSLRKDSGLDMLESNTVLYTICEKFYGFM